MYWINFLNTQINYNSSTMIYDSYKINDKINLNALLIFLEIRFSIQNLCPTPTALDLLPKALDLLPIALD